MSDVILSLVKDSVLTYQQKVNALAHAAEDTLNVFDIPASATLLGCGCNLRPF